MGSSCEKGSLWLQTNYPDDEVDGNLGSIADRQAGAMACLLHCVHAWRGGWGLDGLIDWIG